MRSPLASLPLLLLLPGWAEADPVADAGGPYVVVDAVDDGQDVAVDGGSSSGAAVHEWDCLYDDSGSFDVDATGAQAVCTGLADGTTPVALRVRDSMQPPGEDIDVTSITVIVPRAQEDSCEGCYDLFPAGDDRATPRWADHRDADGLYVWADRAQTQLEFFPWIREISCVGGAAYGHGPTDPEPWHPNRGFGANMGCPGDNSSLAFRELRKPGSNAGEVGYNVLTWKTGLDRYDGVALGNRMCHDSHATSPPGVCQRANTGCTDDADCTQPGDRCVQLVHCAACGQPGATKWDMVHIPDGAGYRNVLHKSFDWRNNIKCDSEAHADIIQASGNVELSEWSVWQSGRILNGWGALSNYKGFSGNAAGSFKGFLFHQIEWGVLSAFVAQMNPVGPFTGRCDVEALPDACPAPGPLCTTHEECLGIGAETCGSVWEGGGVGYIRPCTSDASVWLVGVRVVGDTGDPEQDRAYLNTAIGDGEPGADGTGCTGQVRLIDVQSSICSDDTSRTCRVDADCGAGTCVPQYRVSSATANRTPTFYDTLEEAIAGETALGRPVPPFLQLACAGWGVRPNHCVKSVGPDEVLFIDENGDGIEDPPGGG